MPEYSHEHYLQTKESRLAAQKRYYLKNRDAIVAKQRLYDEANREHINKRQREQKRSKLKTKIPLDD
jgi:hypothetical protein